MGRKRGLVCEGINVGKELVFYEIIYLNYQRTELGNE